MHCNGQCQVMKKILEEEKQQQQTDERKMGIKVSVLSSKSFFATTTEIFIQTIPLIYFIADDNNEVRIPRSVFHPPSA